MPPPFFSVLIPTYNMSNYLNIAIKSVLEQDFQDFELIVCDNASIDDTESIVNSYNDSRIKYYKNKFNLGAINNFNKAISYATGVYIKFLESDDLMNSNCLSALFNCINKDKNINMISTSRVIIDENSKVIGVHSINKAYSIQPMFSKLRVYFKGNEFGTPSDICIRRNILKKPLIFDEIYENYLNDWDLWYNFALKYGCFFLPLICVKVRRHSEQMGVTGIKNFNDINANIKFIKKNFSSIPLLYFALSIKLSLFSLIRALKFLAKNLNKANIHYLYGLIKLYKSEYGLIYIIFLVFNLLFYIPIKIIVYLFILPFKGKS